MIVLIPFVNACQSISVGNFCIWYKPITLTELEFNIMSEETLRQIDNINQEYENQCWNK